MAEINHIVAGWASEYDSPNLAGERTVVVGPSATPAGLISWGAGQLRQLNVLLTVISNAKHEDVEVDPAELCGSIRHQLEQVEAVLVAAIDHLAMKLPQPGDIANGVRS